jgi:hypothetical protein
VIEDGLALLEEHCSGEQEREQARMVGDYTIQIAYDEYADSLAELGLAPKPIC